MNAPRAMSGDVRLVAERPQPGSPRPWRFPAFQRREVAGGRMLACDLPGRPLAMLALVVDAGAVTEPPGREGVSLLAARALSEGTRRRDAYGFAVAGERLGATWRADTDWDSLRCGFEVPADALPAAAELLVEAVRDPGFDEATVLRVRDERVDELALELSQPGPRAGAAFAGAVFAADARYSRPDGGDLATVPTISPDHVREFHTARFTPGNATLVVVGDLSDVDVEAIGHAVFDGWTGEGASPAKPAVTPRDGGRRVVVVDRPGSVQSMLYVGHDGPPRAIPDFVPVTTMALTLGGMFNSRLNYRLREDKGYTYGAFGSFDFRRHGGVFAARTAVRTEVTGAALVDLVKEITLMHDAGVTEAELERARSYRAGVFPISFAAAGTVASALGDIVVHDFADDHFDRLREQILHVRKADLDAAAAERLRPDDLVCIVVGDAAVIGDDVRAAAVGPVEVVTDEG